jgi:hypothetical protein
MPESGAAASATVVQLLTAPAGNADCPWDQFDSRAYLERNYAAVHELDQIIIAILGKFFQSLTPEPGWRGIDVGSGTNLYPALAMMPLAESVTLAEHSAANVNWLMREIRNYGQPWPLFWDALVESADLYQSIATPESMLAAKATVEQTSVFDLAESRWDIGTMFFVSESITARYDEFEIATRRFLRSLRPGAPFAIAFMENSLGYQVGAQELPAVAVTESDIRHALAEDTAQYQLDRILSPEQFRSGYDGMILVTGHRNGSRP